MERAVGLKGKTCCRAQFWVKFSVNSFVIYTCKAENSGKGFFKLKSGHPWFVLKHFFPPLQKQNDCSSFNILRVLSDTG